MRAVWFSFQFVQRLTAASFTFSIFPPAGYQNYTARGLQAQRTFLAHFRNKYLRINGETNKAKHICIQQSQTKTARIHFRTSPPINRCRTLLARLPGDWCPLYSTVLYSADLCVDFTLTRACRLSASWQSSLVIALTRSALLPQFKQS